MIDIENQIIDSVSTFLRSRFPGIQVHSTHLKAPSKFPCVSVYETGNASLEATMDEQGEHHAELRYTVDVYTNDTTGKKQRAKTIAGAIDQHMLGLGFFRPSKQYTIGTNESSIFICSSTYRGIAGESYSGNANEIMIYRR